MSAPLRLDRVLVIVFPARGDVLLATALIRGVKRAHPTAQIDVLTQLGQGDVLHGNPDVRRVIETQRAAPLRLGARYCLSLWRRYDVALSTSASDRALLYALAAARYRVSVLSPRNRWHRFLYQRSVAFDPLLHTVLANARVGALVGVQDCLEVVPPRDPDAGERLDALLPGWRERPFAVLHPTSREAYKRWHAGGWAGLAADLARRGLDLVVTGSDVPGERSYLDELVPRLPASTRDLAGLLTLGQMAELLARCRLYVGVDTLVSHLAASVDAPSVVIFGPTRASKWGPWPYGRTARTPPHAPVGSGRAGNVYVLQGVDDCVPCDRLGCLGHPDSYSECLDTLGVDRALAACEEMLAASEPSEPRPSAARDRRAADRPAGERLRAGRT